MFYLRMFVMLLGFVAASLYGVAIALLRRDRSLVARDYARLLARLTQGPLGVRGVRIRGEENVRAHQPCIYIANHQSYFDVPVLAPIYPAGTVIIAKQELRRLPFFGWLFERTGNIYIDRTDRTQAVGSLKAVEDAIRARGVSVWIFPEGTRGRVPGELLPFKKGAFQMAVGAGVPLVPVVVAPLRPIIDTQARRIRPGVVEIRVLDPITTDGLTQHEVRALMATAWRRMSEALAEMAAGMGLSAAGHLADRAASHEWDPPRPPRARP